MGQGKILSIRLSPDGLSFWTTAPVVNMAGDVPARADLWSQGGETISAFDPSRDIADNMERCAAGINSSTGGNFCAVEIFPDSLRNIAVPEELLTKGSEPAYLAANGIVPSSGEAIFRAEISPGIISLIAYDTEAIRVQNEIWGRECTIKSPFSINSSFIAKYGAGRRRAAAIYLTPHNAYISVLEKRSGAALYMDTLKWAAEADILYAVTLLDKEFGLKKSKVYIRGAKAEQVDKLLRRYYSKSRCE